MKFVLVTLTSGLLLSSSVLADNWQVNISSIPGSASVSPNVYLLSQQPSAPAYDWKNAANGKMFNQLQTFQLEMTSRLAAGTTLTITPPTSDTTDDCAEVFYHGQQAYKPLKTPFDLTTTFMHINWLNENDPIHLTVIPYKNTESGDTCQPPADLAADTVLAIWMSNRGEFLPAPNMTGKTPITCNMTVNPVAENQLPLTADSTEQCPFVRPQWSMIKGTDATGATAYYLKYSGTMAWMIAQQQPIVINIAKGVTVPFPLTTEYVKYPTGVTNDTDMATCNNDLAAYNNSDQKPLANTFPASCKLSAAFLNKTAAQVRTTPAFIRSYTYSENMPYPIYVEGLGRIDGSQIIAKYAQNPYYPGTANGANRPCKLSSNLGSIYPCQIPGIAQSSSDPTIGNITDFVRFAQWRIDTSLLGLSSQYQPTDEVKLANGTIDTYSGNTPAIYIGGITVSNPPKRNRSVVQENVAQFGVGDSITERALNNSPVIMNDFKEVGAWMDATDGPDVGSDGANESNLYYQINDDSLKLEAQNQTVQNATLLQGGVGGIMLGMYGVTRDGIDNSSVKNVDVPRLTQMANSTTWGSYSSTHGLVSTRACPRFFQNGDLSQVPSLGNATVEGVNVFALTDMSNPAVEPNYIDSLISIGIAANSQYCSTRFDTMALSPTYNFGPFTFDTVKSDVPVAHPFVLYDNEKVVSSKPVTIAVWHDLYYGDNYGNASSTYSGDSGLYNFMCPLNGSPTSSQPNLCMQYNTDGDSSQPVASNVSNLSVLPAETNIPNYMQIVHFPYTQ